SDYYLPTKLTNEDYPNLIPPGESVDTLAVPVVLAVYNWPRNSDRFRRVERFVHYYYERFDKLKQPSFHPKWKEINLAARVPGWMRSPVAEEALAAIAAKEPVAARPVGSGETLAGRADVNTAPLFQEFLEWRQKNRRNQ